METLRIILEIVAVLGLAVLSLDKFTDFKYKDLLKEVLIAGKDAKVTEEEWQRLADKAAKVIWGDKPVPTSEEAESK
jgi:hypothetical protein